MAEGGPHSGRIDSVSVGPVLIALHERQHPLRVLNQHRVDLALGDALKPHPAGDVGGDVVETVATIGSLAVFCADVVGEKYAVEVAVLDQFLDRIAKDIAERPRKADVLVYFPLTKTNGFLETGCCKTDCAN